MTVRDGGGFPPHKNVLGRTDRKGPMSDQTSKKDSLEEGDGISLWDRLSAKATTYLFLGTIFVWWLSYIFEGIRKRSGPLVAGLQTTLFAVFLITLGYLLRNIFWDVTKPIFDYFDKSKPRK
jgi:hypothetical protein